MKAASSSSLLTYDDIRHDTVLQVVRLMAESAITAPKSGGQLFLRDSPLFVETVRVEDKETLDQLSAWMKARGKERKEAIWFRDADVAVALPLSMTHKNIAFDKTMPQIDFDSAELQRLPPTHTLLMASQMGNVLEDATNSSR